MAESKVIDNCQRHLREFSEVVPVRFYDPLAGNVDKTLILRLIRLDRSLFIGVYDKEVGTGLDSLTVAYPSKHHPATVLVGDKQELAAKLARRFNKPVFLSWNLNIVDQAEVESKLVSFLQSNVDHSSSYTYSYSSSSSSSGELAAASSWTGASGSALETDKLSLESSSLSLASASSLAFFST